MKSFINSLVRQAPWLLGPMFWLRYAVSSQYRDLLRPHLIAYREVRAAVGLSFAKLPKLKQEKRVLILPHGDIPAALIERVLMSGFESADFSPIVVAPNIWPFRRVLSLLGIDGLLSPAQFKVEVSEDEINNALSGIDSLTSLLSLTVKGVSIGNFVVATIMRTHRLGTFSLDSPAFQSLLANAVRQSITAIKFYQILIDTVRPDAVLMSDHGYTPYGEAFELFLINDLPVYSWNATHENGHVTMKLYTEESKNEHPYANSDSTWKYVKDMPWSEDLDRQLENTITEPYKCQEWFAVMGTQFNAHTYDTSTVFTMLGLDPKKKTAIIFPHMFWDAAFFWGEDLFENFEEWFKAVLQAACGNKQLNWIIKIHPGNTVRQLKDGAVEEFAEIRAINETIGNLPPHVQVLLPDTKISTLSLFDVMDFCLTVRGTIGLEAACRGVRALTGGTGRYDRRGFTLDFNNGDTLLETIRDLHNIRAMHEYEIELARRYAYAAFVARSVPLQSVQFHYRHDKTATLESRLMCPDTIALSESPDVIAIAEWLGSGTEDLIKWPENKIKTVASS